MNEPVHLLCFSEHWMTSNYDCKYDDYTLAAIYIRKEHLHGGVCIYVRKDIKCYTVVDFYNEFCTDMTFECCGIKVIIEKVVIYVLTIYHTGPESTFKIFFQKLEELLMKLMDSEKHKIIIAGDFNLDVLKHSSTRTQFFDLLSSYSIKWMINEPTRITNNSATAIDNVLTNLNAKEIDVSVIHSKLSDHAGQFCKVYMQIKTHNVGLISKRFFTEEALQYFQNDMFQYDWENLLTTVTVTVDQMFENFLYVTQSKFNIHFPIKKVVPRNLNKTDCWLTPELKEQKEKLKLLASMCPHYPEAKVKYEEEKKLYTIELQKRKRDSYSGKLQKEGNSSKTCWQVVNGILGKEYKKDTKLPNCNNIMDLANEFNHFFINVASSIQPQISDLKYVNNSKTMFLYPPSDSEIFNIINELKHKRSAGFDEIPPFVIKRCSNIFTHPLKIIIEQSFLQGEFPSQLKLAQVVPLYKKGDADDMNNYRPVSLLSSFSKVFEKTMYNRIMDFLMQCNYFASFQHGFMKQKNTTTAIFQFLKTAQNSVDDGKITCGIMLDLSKAFDMIDHSIMLEKLCAAGIRGRALEWLESYLVNRKQQVVLHKNNIKVKSDTTIVTKGAPQGSILAPLLFIIYLNELTKTILPECTLINYADDSNLLVCARTFPAAVNLMDKQMNRLQNWFKENSLLLNSAKTQIVFFRTSRNNFDFPNQLELNGELFSVVNATRFLGVYIDSCGTWANHIDYLCHKASSVCYMMKILSRELQLPVLKTVYHANFVSIIKYGIIFWGNASDTIRLFRLQKRCLRFMIQIKRTESCRSLFRMHNILTVTGIYIMESAMFVRKHPSYFIENTFNHDYSTRHKKNYALTLHSLSATQKNCHYISMKIYNSLPDNLKATTSLNVYKQELYNYICDMEPYTLEEFFNFK